MNYKLLEDVDRQKHKEQLVQDLTLLRKRLEEIKMVLKSEKMIVNHYKEVVEVKDRCLEELHTINDEFLKEIGRLRASIKKLTNE
jgi:mevalonate kinase